jgi:polysaccharide biosynthesis transport protein
VSSDLNYTKSTPLREYVNVLKRRRWWLIVTVVACVGAAGLITFKTTPMYQTTAQLTYQRQVDASSALTGANTIMSVSDVAQALDTYANLMSTEVMRARAAAELGVAADAQLGATISSEGIQDTAILQITGTSSDPRTAQRVANAYAIAFTKWRQATTVQSFRSAEEVVATKMRQFTTPELRKDAAYYALAARLEDLKVLESTSTGNFVIAAPATLPEQPFSPSHPRDLLLGLLAGVLVGLLLVAVREQLDVRVRASSDLGSALGMPVLGRLPRVSRDVGASHKLVAVSDPAGAVAEACRILRGNLEFVDIDGNLTSVLVTSCTQGEGKTTAVCNLAATLARAGKKVVVVDCDLRRPKTHTYFGLRNSNGVSTVVSGKITLSEALQDVHLPTVEEPDGSSVAVIPPIRVLTSGPLPPNPGEIVTSQRLASVISELSDHADLVLIDAPPFLAVGDAAALARTANGLLVVMRLGTVTKAMLKETAEFLDPLPCRKLGIVVTNIPAEGSAHRYRYYSKDSGEYEPETSPAEASAPSAGSI